jgi:hypothetical protein
VGSLNIIEILFGYQILCLENSQYLSEDGNVVILVFVREGKITVKGIQTVIPGPLDNPSIGGVTDVILALDELPCAPDVDDVAILIKRLHAVTGYVNQMIGIEVCRIPSDKGVSRFLG